MSENKKYTIVIERQRVEVSEAVYRAYHKDREAKRYQNKLIRQNELSLERFHLPIHIRLCNQQYGLLQNSLVLLEQMRTIDCFRLREYIGHLRDSQMQQVNEALAMSFGLDALLPEPQMSLSM